MCKLTCAQFLSKPHPNYIFIFLVKKIGSLAMHTFSLGKGKISSTLDHTLEFLFCGLLIIKNKIYIRVPQIFVCHHHLVFYNVLLGVLTLCKCINMHIHLPSFFLPCLW